MSMILFQDSHLLVLWHWGFKLPPYLDAPLFDAVAEMLNPIAKGRGGALGYVVCADLREVPFSPGLWWEKLVGLKDFQSLQTTANHFFFSPLKNFEEIMCFDGRMNGHKS